MQRTTVSNKIKPLPYLFSDRHQQATCRTDSLRVRHPRDNDSQHVLEAGVITPHKPSLPTRSVQPTPLKTSPNPRHTTLTF